VFGWAAVGVVVLGYRLGATCHSTWHGTDTPGCCTHPTPQQQAAKEGHPDGAGEEEGAAAALAAGAGVDRTPLQAAPPAVPEVAGQQGGRGQKPPALQAPATSSSSSSGQNAAAQKKAAAEAKQEKAKGGAAPAAEVSWQCGCMGHVPQDAVLSTSLQLKGAPGVS
jgi:hypothetical protein